MAGGGIALSRHGGFGTLSSSLIAMPSPEAGDPRGHWLFANGRPGEVGDAIVEA